MKPLSILFLSASLALGAAGCGGDDKKTDTTRGYSAARGYDDTIKATNDICNRARAATDPISKRLTGTVKTDAPILKKLAAANKRYVDEIDALQPDPKLRDVFDRFKKSVDDIQAETVKLAGNLDGVDDDGYRQSIEAINQLDEQNDKIARELGANDCAKG